MVAIALPVRRGISRRAAAGAVAACAAVMLVLVPNYATRPRPVVVIHQPPVAITVTTFHT